MAWPVDHMIFARECSSRHVRMSIRKSRCDYYLNVATKFEVNSLIWLPTKILLPLRSQVGILYISRTILLHTYPARLTLFHWLPLFQHLRHPSLARPVQKPHQDISLTSINFSVPPSLQIQHNPSNQLGLLHLLKNLQRIKSAQFESGNPTTTSQLTSVSLSIFSTP